MEIEFLLRVFKSIVISMILFFSCLGLGMSGSSSFLLALIPLVLGVLNMFAGYAYMVSILTFVFCILTIAYPNLKTGTYSFLNSVDQLSEQAANPPAHKSP